MGTETTMSKLSKCASRPTRRSALSVRRIGGVVVMAGVAFTFCLAQLSLKFSLSDLERETRVLQREREDLQSRINRLKGDVARLEQGDRLVQRARDLGMVEFVVADVERMAVDPEIVTEYAIARAEFEDSGGRESAPAAEPAEFGRAVAMRLGFEQPALARSN